MPEPPTYEELTASVSTLKTKMDGYQKELTDFTAAKKGTHEDDEMEASFKKATDEMNQKEKKHTAEKDNIEKVKDAFKKAEDEKDPEKKKDAMKKAMDDKEDYDQKHAKKAESEPTSPKDKKDMEAKVANIIMKKIPLMEKILTATKMIDPTNYSTIEKQLNASTLEEVEKQYNILLPYMAATGLQKPNTQKPQTGMIPFQAGLVTDSTDVFDAAIDDIDFGKISTSKLMEMYR